jgi:hypothetical protein
MRSCFISIRLAKTKTTDYKSVSENVETLEPLCTANGKVGIENSLVFPQNVSYVAI